MLDKEEKAALEFLDKTYSEITRIRKKYPYLSRWVYVRDGCSDPNHINWKYSGKYDIKCQITPEDMKMMWERDKANEIVRPVFTRLDRDKHFTVNNSKFMSETDYRKLLSAQKQDRQGHYSH